MVYLGYTYLFKKEKKESIKSCLLTDKVCFPIERRVIPFNETKDLLFHKFFLFQKKFLLNNYSANLRSLISRNIRGKR